MRKWLFNPFVYVAGARALIIGLIVMAVTSGICVFSHTHFNGLLQMGFRASEIWHYFFEGFVCWSVPVTVFYAAGLLFSKSHIRLIDVAGTFALARWVMIFIAFAGFGMHLPPSKQATIAEIVNSITPVTIVLSLLGLLCMVWMVALLYNAFVISCNIKRGKAAVFIVCLLIADILSRLIIHFTH